jgi:hypothetical protein
VSRPLLVAVVLVAFPLPCPAQNSEMVIRLNLQPMAAPRPALKYQLLPELAEMQPGNPIPNYLRAILDDYSSSAKKNDVQTRQQLMESLLADLPVAQQREYGSMPLRQVDRAARLDNPDWQILLKLKTDGFGLLLPDVQVIRRLAAGLQERFHTEAVSRRFDAGIGTAKTMFAMARHLAEHPTLIADLVGVAIAAIAIGPLEEMLQQPGCPNLYWALTDLPSPLVNFHKGVQGERVLVAGEFRILDDKEPMSPAQLAKFIEHFNMVLGKAKYVQTWLEPHLKDEARLRAARGRLVEMGLPEERVKKFPPTQVLLLDEKRDFELRRDEETKLFGLPTWQVEAVVARAKLPGEKNLFYELYLSFIRLRRAQGRLEQRIALLRHIEAIRLYAAHHDGKLPQTLAEVDVPLPDDPFTGKPFRYKVEGQTAHLQGTPPHGEEKNPGFNIHYELTIQK